MKSFFKLVLYILKGQFIARMGALGQILFYVVLPIFVAVQVLEKYEEDMPKGMLDVLLMLVGFGALGFLIFKNIRDAKRAAKEEEELEE